MSRRMTAKGAEQSARIRLFIRKLKENKVCPDCKLPWPYYCMDFDHVRGQKKFEISQAAKLQVSWEALKAELAKCQLCCSNCHRHRTYRRACAKFRLMKRRQR